MEISFDPQWIIMLIIVIIILFRINILKARLKEKNEEIMKLKEALNYFQNKK
ncbi:MULTISPECIES: hypothetical protein [Bacillaceae]|uniref:hypothetical protein n=1 Tax=Bacillaceae TaxID=186817 RepID=UPI00159BB9EB|nr:MULTISPECIES: hypothetical protein [Bacillaceae]UGB28834.1 hypothetical protein LPC09_13645 [Metabacillus sp. B2-18]